MQKDFHFYVTYTLARKAQIPERTARQIAWADQFTDDLDDFDLYGIQTQCKKLGNWSDRQVQLSVLVPFHFLPGGTSRSKWPWKTTENNARARQLLRTPVSTENPLSLGIALHALQDTFSHQGFSGWDEERNSCYPWYYLKSGLPNVGHAEMLVVPDIVDREWVDPRTGENIDNKERAIRAARETFGALAKYSGIANPESIWSNLDQKLARIFANTSYDKRKNQLRRLSGSPSIRYSRITTSMQKRLRSRFLRAAAQHLAGAMKLLEDLW